MTDVFPLRPGRPVPVPISAEWDEAHGLYVAACERCCETATAHRIDQAEEWVETHRCDPELVALLADVLSGTAA
jgi:hypothetical protein